MKQKAAYLFCLLFLSAVGFAQSPVANFSSDITAGCSPIVVSFKDQSTGNPTSWLWDFGNGATSTLQNPSTTYFAPGIYNVKLTVTNASGSNTNTKNAYITVYVEPTVQFSVDKNSGCSPAAFQFTDQSSTPAGTQIISWKWEFGDGGSSTQQNPRYIYRTPGSYTVSLTITTDKGCVKLITKPNYINVTTGVVPSFSYAEPADCSAPVAVNFNNASTGPATLSYNWNLGNGNTATTLNASTTYATNGTYRVSLIVSSTAGCVDSMVRDVVIGRVNTDFIVPNAVCPKRPSQFLNNSTPRPIRSLWQFSTGYVDTFMNANYSFPAGGTYTVTLINTYTTCSDTITKTVNVLAGPTINFVSPDTGRCKPPLTANFTNSTNGVSYLWNFGDGGTSTQANPAHTYANYGDYDVTLIATDANGCVDTLKKPAYIKIRKPVITFPDLPYKGCAPATIVFKANLAGADTIATYNWNFGDGSPSSNLPQPSHFYANTGTYTVTLTATTSSGCTETISLAAAVRLGTKPTADFTATPLDVCANQPVQFTNLSSNPTDEWLWIFGDGGTSRDKNPSYVFNDTGWLDVKMVAMNNGCPSDTMYKQDYVHIKPPVSKFDYTPDCNNPLQYTFLDKSIGALTWQWDFGDGTTFTGQNPPMHTYASNGTYNVSLITTNGSCTFTATRSIVIRDYTPDFSAAIREGCKPFTTQFIPTSPNPDMMESYYWDFGNGDSIDFGHRDYGQYTYTQSGSYYVTLTTIDTFGCKHSVTKPNYIQVNGPNPKFGSSNNAGCKGLTTVFSDSTTTDGVNALISWRWDFGDGTPPQTFTAPPFSHTYDSIGNYDVKLVVTDAKGCMDSVTYREFVKISTLKADWSTSGATCPGGNLYFANESTSDLPFTSLWSFGDGQTSTDHNSFHAYTDTGYYSVMLKVRDLVGCEDSMTITDAVHVSIPVASFTANNFTTYCTPFEAKFTNTSTFYQSSFWDLSTGTSNQTNPVLYYTNSGTYPIKLVVTSPGGCKDSVTNTLRVFNPQDGNLTYNPINGCTPLTVDFSAFSPMNGRFIWDFGDGYVVDTTINQMQHTYTNFGDFVPKIILIEPTGSCVVPITGGQTINLLGVKADYKIDNQFFCDSGFVRIDDSTTFNDPIVSYNWNFGDGSTYNTSEPVHQYTTPGIYTVSLVVNTQNGCTDTLERGPVKIVQSPLISMQTDTMICINERVAHLGIMERPDTSLVKWSWQFPNGNAATIQNPDIQQYNTAGTYNVTVIATNSSGCADTVTQRLLVNPLPIITVPPQLTKMVGVPLTLPATYSDSINRYAWSPTTGLDCFDCPQPVTNTKFNTRYTIAVEDSNGCKNSEQIQVIVLCPGTTVFVPNTFSPNGDGANDVFYVRGQGLDRVKSIRVFNRWGEIVFEQKDFPVNNPSYGWNGLYKGRAAQPDVYVYQAEVFCENSEIIRFEGNLALIK